MESNRFKALFRESVDGREPLSICSSIEITYPATTSYKRKLAKPGAFFFLDDQSNSLGQLQGFSISLFQPTLVLPANDGHLVQSIATFQPQCPPFPLSFYWPPTHSSQHEENCMGSQYNRNCDLPARQPPITFARKQFWLWL
jgi:hypothetical protein